MASPRIGSGGFVLLKELRTAKGLAAFTNPEVLLRRSESETMARSSLREIGGVSVDIFRDGDDLKPSPRRLGARALWRTG